MGLPPGPAVHLEHCRQRSCTIARYTAGHRRQKSPGRGRGQGDLVNHHHQNPEKQRNRMLRHISCAKPLKLPVFRTLEALSCKNHPTPAFVSVQLQQPLVEGITSAPGRKGTGPQPQAIGISTKKDRPCWGTFGNSTCLGHPRHEVLQHPSRANSDRKTQPERC